MRTVVRAFAMCVVIVGVTAAALPSPTKYTPVNHQAPTPNFPIPQCGPGIPCPPDPDGSIR